MGFSGQTVRMPAFRRPIYVRKMDMFIPARRIDVSAMQRLSVSETVADEAPGSAYKP